MTYEEFKKFENDLKDKFELYEKERQKWIQVDLINNDIELLKNFCIKDVEIHFENCPDSLLFDKDTDFLKGLFVNFLEYRKDKLINERESTT